MTPTGLRLKGFLKEEVKRWMVQITGSLQADSGHQLVAPQGRTFCEECVINALPATKFAPFYDLEVSLSRNTLKIPIVVAIQIS
jgi:hypothetical protein